jgi:hypothetical protein
VIAKRSLPADNLVCSAGHRSFAADPTAWAGRPCSECGGTLQVFAGSLDEHRSASRAQSRSPSEFYRRAEALMAQQPKTPAGYTARLAALEDLLRLEPGELTG